MDAVHLLHRGKLIEHKPVARVTDVHRAAQNLLGEGPEQERIHGPQAVPQHRVIPEHQHPRVRQKILDAEALRVAAGVPQGRHLLKGDEPGADLGKHPKRMPPILKNAVGDDLGARVAGRDGADALGGIQRIIRSRNDQPDPTVRLKPKITA